MALALVALTLRPSSSAHASTGRWLAGREVEESDWLTIGALHRQRRVVPGLFVELLFAAAAEDSYGRKSPGAMIDRLSTALRKPNVFP
jgi:hypothetical protein